MDQPAGPSGDRSPVRNAPTRRAHLLGMFALCGVAIAQPTFAMLGEEPTYFVVHGLEGLDLLWFALVLVLVPPMLLFAALLTIRAVSVAAERRVMTFLVGALVALAIVPAIDRGIGLPDVLFIVLLCVLGTGVAMAYARWSPARFFVSYLSPAPVLFAVLFLTTSSASALWETSDGDILPKRELDVPVVVLVLDEFALGVLLNADGSLDTAHFPGFGRLAEQSTWYPNATTTAGRTDLAVPTILSGSIRPEGTPPTAAEYPRSLFAMLGASYSVRADEVVTRICPDTVCSDEAPTEGSIVHDTAIAYLHGLLPDDLAASWLPPLGARWGGFADERGDADTTAAGDAQGDASGAATGAEPSETSTPDLAAEASHCANIVCTRDWDAIRFQSFLSEIGDPASTPQLLYHHMLLPHVPYRYFPDGTNYEPISVTWGLDPVWIDDPDFMAVMTQRYVLQAMYVDRLIGELLDRLDATSTFDDALIVIVADHGVSLEPGGGLRGSGDGQGPGRHGVQPVPLFVKLSGQRDGTVDERPAQIVDVLPTIADALGLDLPDRWEFEGRSLLGTPAGTGPRRWLDGQLSSELDPESFGARVRSVIVDLAGRTDFVGVGPHGSLVGSAIADLDVEEGTRGSIRLDHPDAYATVDPAGLVPGLFTASTDGLTIDDWVAIAIDGIVAGLGPVYTDDGQMVALLDPRSLGAGSHEVRAFQVRPDGSSLTELSVTT
jgi:hypothetical protein